MTKEQIRSTLAQVISRVAPEAELDDVDPADDLREQLDIDSMDFLNILVGLKEHTGVEIPEADYKQVETLDALINYVHSRAA